MIAKFLLLAVLQQTATANLWLHVNVKKIERKVCIIDETSWGNEGTGCAQLKHMTLDERILPNHERRSTSFEHIEGLNRPTVTHWPVGKLADWMVALQFITIDPVYGIARTCDRSGFVRAFQNVTEEKATLHQKVVKIQGQCFTATVEIQASSEICPWCVEEREGAEKMSTTIAPQNQKSNSGESAFLLIAMLSLTVISVMALFGTGILLIFYISDKRKIESKSKVPVYELPDPVYDGKASSCSTWATRPGSEEQWGEYPTERWESYHPAVSPRFTTYREQEEEAGYCTSSDSGRSSR